MARVLDERSGERPDTTPRPHRRSGAVLFAGTMVGNVLAYGFFVVLSRVLSADDLGAVGSLVNLAAVSTVAGLGIQLVAARTSAGRGAGERLDAPARQAFEREALGTGLRVGMVIAAVVAAISPVVATLLHLDGPVGVLAVALAAVPMAVTYAVQGILQGEERFGALATAYLLAGVARIVGAGVAAAAGLGPNGVMLVFAVGWLVTAVLVTFTLPAGSRIPGRASHHLGREGLHATVPVSGLLVLSSLDVLLARHHLSRDASGDYTVGALFEKVAFWGTSFLATLYFPRMSRTGQRRRAVATALGLTTAAGVVGVLLAWLAGAPLVRIVGGEGFVPTVGPLAWAFTLFGVTLAVLQVLVYADLSRAGRVVGAVVWAGVAAAVGAVALWHDGVGAVVRDMLGAGIVTVVVAAAVLALPVVRRSPG